MGQCCSAGRPRPLDAESQGDCLQAGLADRVLHPPILGSQGLQLAVSQARLSAAAGGDATPVLVRHTPRGLFIALFEGLGEDRHSVANFCRSRVLEVSRCCEPAAATASAQQYRHA